MTKFEKRLNLGKVYCRYFTILSSVFDVKNQKPKTDLESATSLVLPLKFLWTLKFTFL